MKLFYLAVLCICFIFSSQLEADVIGERDEDILNIDSIETAVTSFLDDYHVIVDKNKLLQDQLSLCQEKLRQIEEKNVALEGSVREANTALENSRRTAEEDAKKKQAEIDKMAGTIKKAKSILNDLNLKIRSEAATQQDVSNSLLLE